ncbi:hypothetical protein [Coleofasciculus sp. H7-2]|uniref:hypothetical protein n=1 Tax=Coleofasciculus sp. H7-2 TaxID=3351545 RepID=UPI00366F4AA6
MTLEDAVTSGIINKVTNYYKFLSLDKLLSKKLAISWQAINGDERTRHRQRL